MTVYEKVEKILQQMAENKDIKINANDDLFSIGVLDSLNVVLLISQIFEDFEIEIPFESLIPQNLESLEAITSLVKKYVIEK